MDRGTTLVERSSAKEDRDYLLDYKSIDLSSIRREDILDVPVDNINRDEAVALILDMIENRSGPHHVLFLDPIKLMRLRRSKKLRHILDDARLVLADGAGIGWAAARLGTPLKERIPMIAMIMDIVRLAWKQEYTIYLLGSRMEYLERVFFNMQRSFPGVRIIGRQEGYFGGEREALVKESLRKSAPDIIFLGMGFPTQEQWLHENKEYLSRSVVIGVDGAFDILSGKEKKAPDWFQTRGLAWFWRTLARPLYIDRMFAAFFFFVMTLWRSFRKR